MTRATEAFYGSFRNEKIFCQSSMPCLHMRSSVRLICGCVVRETFDLRKAVQVRLTLKVVGLVGQLWLCEKTSSL